MKPDVVLMLFHCLLIFRPCSYPYTKAEELVRELQKLQHLQSLALPAALLCNRCCPEKHYPGLRASLECLIAQPNLRKLDLLTLPEATMGTTFFCGHPASVAEGMAALRAKAAAARGCVVQHGTTSGASSIADHNQQQQQQQQQGELELELAVEEAEWADDCFLSSKGPGHPVWGVYVSSSEW
jgi:hypothetical protein